MTKLWIVLVSAAAMAGAVALSVSAQEGGQAQRPAPMAGAMTQPAGPDMMCPMCRMRMQHQERLHQLQLMVGEAEQAAKEEKAQRTLGKLAEIRQLLDRHEQEMSPGQGMRHGMMRQGQGEGKMMHPAGARIVNERCPISGMKIDPNKVPENLTRMYKGQKIGFCSDVCPEQWDKLRDAEKQAKLEAVMPKAR
jgi:YHS domain-containing protein